jgi:hypothetical protein
VAIPAAAAQQEQGRSHQAHRVTAENPGLRRQPRPLTLDEGLAIIGAALDSRHHAAFKSDCSHFVHGLYERAGFPYAYAPSSDLYAGIDEFRRVVNPQPGDLAVWRGHTGIVINPVQHSFFSLLRSGPGVGSYDSAYWKRKGHPRFFRYVTAVPGGSLSSSLRTASLRPTALDSAEPREPGAGDPVSDVEEELSTENASPTQRVANQRLNTTRPGVAVVNSIHPKPDQVGAAFLQACTASEPSLRGRDFFNSPQPVIVFDHFTVKKVHIAGSQDWVDVQIDELVSLTGGKAEVHKRSERQRWPLTRRDKTSWELTPPRNTLYLPQPIAVRLLAQQLAQRTEDSPVPASRTEENAELARLLDVLLEK